MRTHPFLMAGLLLGAVAIQAGDAQSGRAIDAKAAYARLKALAGEWKSDGDNGQERLSYQVIADGTAVVERDTAGQRPEMLTVYHLDGGRLLLTHYCMAGNQPRMQAQRFDPETGELEFQFVDATNLANPAAGHMHAVRLRFVDNEHLDSVWQFYENGRPKMTETSRFTRVR